MPHKFSHLKLSNLQSMLNPLSMPSLPSMLNLSLSNNHMSNPLKLSNKLNPKLKATLRISPFKKLTLIMKQLSLNTKYPMKDNMWNMFPNKELNMYQSPEPSLNTKPLTRLITNPSKDNTPTINKLNTSPSTFLSTLTYPKLNMLLKKELNSIFFNFRHV